MQTLEKDPQTALAPLNSFENELKQKATEYGKLTIAGIADDEGYKAVKAARLVLKKLRTSTENVRKELKEPYLEMGKAIDARAKELTAIIEPTEKRLEALEKEHDAAKERAEREALQKRVDALAKVGASYPLDQLAKLSEEDFEALLAQYTELYEERKRKEDQERAELEELRALKAKQQSEEAKLSEAIEEESRNNQKAFVAEMQANRSHTTEAVTVDADTEGDRQKLRNMAQVFINYRPAKTMECATPRGQEASAWALAKVQEIGNQLISLAERL